MIRLAAVAAFEDQPGVVRPSGGQRRESDGESGESNHETFP